MSRRPLRTLFTALILTLALAAAVPAPSEAAAGSHRGDPGVDRGWSLTDFLPQWVVSLFERTGWGIDPHGSGGTVTIHGDGGDIGLHIDPNG